MWIGGSLGSPYHLRHGLVGSRAFVDKLVSLDGVDSSGVGGWFDVLDSIVMVAFFGVTSSNLIEAAVRAILLITSEE